MNQRQRRRARLLVVLGVVLTGALAAAPGGTAAPKPKVITTAAFDVSPPVAILRPSSGPREQAFLGNSRSGNANVPVADSDAGYAGDAGLQSSGYAAMPALGPLVNFEGLSNTDNFNVFGFRVNPPDPVGDVGPNHYVEMVNLVFGVWDKAGNKLLGPIDTGALWAGFPIEDCTDPSGDPIVLYDQTTDRWLLSQFTTRGLDDPALPFYNCVAISTSGDPTGSYYRYAFITQQDVDGGYYFPDYPKYGVWTNSYLMTTRDFGSVDGYGISVYALEKNKMVNGEAKARAVQFFLDSEDPDVNLEDIGDGLLPADIDGNRRPQDHAPAPIVGTQDDGGGYAAAPIVDAVNIYDLAVQWRRTRPPRSPARSSCRRRRSTRSSRAHRPRGTASRSRGSSIPAQYLDILSYRQRPTHRLAYRNFGKYETLVTNQSVEARPGIAGVRWYELRRVDGVYSIHQQGTYAPADGVHRWMGSAAMDRNGSIAIGYSVVNGTNVFPGIRYTGRLAGDPAGQMTVAEGNDHQRERVQTTTNSRWGDYTSLNVDPVDDCTFWYVNEYYTAAGQASSAAGWQTRIANFRLPGCS